jgi:hypothetical protein
MTSLQGWLLTAFVFIGLFIGLFLIPYLSAKYPGSWLAILGAVLAVISGIFLAVVLSWFIVQGMDRLSSNKRYLVIFMCLYLGAFVLCELIAREQRRAHLRRGELTVGDWTRRFVKARADSDTETLATLYEQGLWLESEFGGLVHPDFRKNMKFLSDWVAEDLAEE